MAPKKVTVKVRGVDPDAYRLVQARAKREGRSVGEVLSTIISQWTSLGERFPKRGSLLDLTPESFGPGSERLSEQIDEVVYGVPPRKANALDAARTFKPLPPSRGSFVDDPFTILEGPPRRRGAPARRRTSKRCRPTGRRR